MSKVCARRLIAGTVKPETSPRLRAMYSSWMDADWTPRTWLASQTIQRAASAVASSAVNAARPGQVGGRLAPEARGIIDDELVLGHVHDPGQVREQVGG